MLARRELAAIRLRWITAAAARHLGHAQAAQLTQDSAADVPALLVALAVQRAELDQLREVARVVQLPAHTAGGAR